MSLVVFFVTLVARSHTVEGSLSGAETLEPGGIIKNDTADTLYVLSDSIFTDLLRQLSRCSLDRRRNELLETRAALADEWQAAADSALALRTVEATYWHDKLLSCDGELEQERLARSMWYNSRLFWFVVGALTAGVIIEAR